MNILLYAPEYRPNLSNMIRTTEFYGFKKIYIYDQNGLMNPPSNKVTRAEMNHMARVWTAGAIEHINIEVIEDIESFFETYEGRKVATVVNENAENLYDFHFQKNDLIIVGPEKEGLPSTAVNVSDTFLYIPRFGTTDCLNVSVALGIVISESKRQLHNTTQK